MKVTMHEQMISYAVVVHAIRDLERACAKTRKRDQEMLARWIIEDLEEAVRNGQLYTQPLLQHGSWEVVEDKDWSQPERFRCTACDHKWKLQSKQYLAAVRKSWLHCPNCGAKMDGGAEDV